MECTKTAEREILSGQTYANQSSSGHLNNAAEDSTQTQYMKSKQKSPSWVLVSQKSRKLCFANIELGEVKIWADMLFYNTVQMDLIRP